MAKETIAQITTDLVQPLVTKQDLILWDVVFEKEGSNWYLRVYLDGKDRPVTIEDCEVVSRPLSDLLDETDPIDQSYFLEVSSAGLGRRLRKESHLLASVGMPVEVKLIRPINGEREFYGTLISAEKSNFKLDVSDELYEFSLSDCAYVKRADDLDF